MTDGERRRMRVAFGLQETRAFLLARLPRDATARRLAKVVEHAIDVLLPQDPPDERTMPKSSASAIASPASILAGSRGNSAESKR